MNSTIKTSIQQSLKELDEAFNAIMQGDINQAALRVWHASLEVEYALFVLKRQLKIEDRIVCKQDKLDNVGIKECIVRIRELLQTASKFLDEGNLNLVLENVYAARIGLISFQEKY